MSLRQYKAARLKLDILEQAVRLIGKKPYQDLHVADICKRVKVSKVTFFNYFNSKEELLMYWQRIWCFQRTADLHSKPRHGLAGLHFLFESMSEAAEANPGLVHAMIAYLNDLKRPAKPFPVKPDEKVLLYPKSDELAALEIRPLEQMVEHFVQEAIQKKELSQSASVKDVSSLAMSVLYGTLMVNHLGKQGSASTAVRKTLDLALKGLK